ncbi:MAG: glycosyltransferase [Dehalococcoidia bacterium]
MGFKQGLENVVAAARLAAGQPNPPLFVLMGDGNQRADLQALAADLPNVRFLPPQPDGDFPDVLAAADVLLVNQRPSVVDMSLPGKLTSYFVAGRPVVAAVAPHSETAAEITAAGAGLVVDAGDPDALLAAIRVLEANPGRASALGAFGPPYAEAHLSADGALATLERFVATIAGRAPLAGMTTRSIGSTEAT